MHYNAYSYINSYKKVCVIIIGLIIHLPFTKLLIMKKCATDEGIDTNVCCMCFANYEDDIDGCGAEWIKCAWSDMY